MIFAHVYEKDLLEWLLLQLRYLRVYAYAYHLVEGGLKPHTHTLPTAYFIRALKVSEISRSDYLSGLS